MTAADEHAEPPAESTPAPGDGSRRLTVGLTIGLVLCLLLAVGIALSTRQQIAELARERDAARSEVQKLTADSAARTEQFVLAARLELAEIAHLLVVARQNPYTGKDISDPVLPDSIAGKRRAALTAAFALKDAHPPFKWGSRKKEDGVDSVGFVAVALSEAGMLLKPEVLTIKSLQNLLNVTTVGEPQPGDILFFDNGIVMFYLGGDNAVGMLPEGAATKGGILKGKGIGFKYLGYGTVRYD
jgi:hypothetical protein